jgi:hypothetical protein
VLEGSDIGDSRRVYEQITSVSVPSLAEWSARRYDEAMVSLGFMVRSMNFDWKVALQVLFFSTTSIQKSIEIP